MISPSRRCTNNNKTTRLRLPDHFEAKNQQSNASFDAFTRTFSLSTLARFRVSLKDKISLLFIAALDTVLTSLRAFFAIGCMEFASSGDFRFDVEGCGCEGIIVSRPPPDDDSWLLLLMRS